MFYILENAKNNIPIGENHQKYEYCFILLLIASVYGGQHARALLSLPERNREIIFLYFSEITHNKKSEKCTDAAGVRPGIKSAGR